MESILNAEVIHKKYQKHKNFKELILCNTCGLTKHYTKFYINKRKSPAGYRLDDKCKLCKLEQSRTSKWKNKYGVSEKEVYDAYKQQVGKCLICSLELTIPTIGSKNKTASVFHIDHNHITGKFRGLLCHHCNTGLGHFKDDIRLLVKAQEYLQNGN